MKKVKWAVYSKDEYVKVAGLVKEVRKLEPIEINKLYSIVLFKGKAKAVGKLIGKMSDAKIKYEFVDPTTYELMRDCHPWKNSKKEEVDGKIISKSFGMGAKTPRSEANSVRMDTDGKTGGDDGYLPGADPGRPGCSEENRRCLPILVHEQEREYGALEFGMISGGSGQPTVEPCIGLAASQYAKRYVVPIRTVRSWIKKGVIKTVKQDDRNIIVQGPLYPWRPDIQKSSPKGVKWEWLDWKEYCEKRRDWTTWWF